MNNIVLTKEMKVKLLEAIQAGELDLSDFPELLLPVKVDVSTLTFGQLKSQIYGYEEKAFLANSEEGRNFLSTYDIGRDFLKHYDPNDKLIRLPKWFFESEEDRKRKSWIPQLEH